MTTTKSLPGSLDIYLEGIAAATRMIQLEYDAADPTTTSHASALKRISQAESLLNTTRRDIVRNMRAQGLTWADIGGTLGVSRQAAQQLYSK